MSISAHRPDELISILRSDFPLGLVPIIQVTLAAPAVSVTLPPAGTISQTFRALVLHCLARTDLAAVTDALLLRFNADAGANYNWQRLRGNNAAAGAMPSAGATSINLGAVDGANATANSFAAVTVHIPQYRAALYKAVLAETTAFGNGAVANFYRDAVGGQWMSLAAITSMTLLPSGGANLAAGSVFSLYGIL